MSWEEICKLFPSRWLLVEAIDAHSENERRFLDDIAVIDTYPSGRAAIAAFLELHEKPPRRELYVLSTDREILEIEELRWSGIRGAA
jgi:hypothetical protein